MQIAATQKMANVGQEKTRHKKYQIRYCKLTEANYKMLVDYNIFNAWDYNDILKNGLVRCIVIYYPSNYYASERYISTCEITNEIKRNTTNYTLDNIIAILDNMIEI